MVIIAINIIRATIDINLMVIISNLEHLLAKNFEPFTFSSFKVNYIKEWAYFMVRNFDF